MRLNHPRMQPADVGLGSKIGDVELTAAASSDGALVEKHMPLSSSSSSSFPSSAHLRALRIFMRSILMHRVCWQRCGHNATGPLLAQPTAVLVLVFLELPLLVEAMRIWRRPACFAPSQ
jgi:hypothetical protein